MNDLISFVSSEVTALFAAADKREAAIGLAERLFDRTIAKIDLPGPDAVIDPILRAALRPLVGRVYDCVAQKLEEKAHA
jgi:hypothetical protein